MSAEIQLGGRSGGAADDETGTLIARFAQLIATQRLWAIEWQELADYVIPRKNSILVQLIPGSKRTQRLYDSTAPNAAELLANSIHGGLTSSYLRWFFLEPDDTALSEVAAVREWLDETSERMNAYFNRSNLGSEVHELYIDLVVFATGCMLFEEKRDPAGRFEGFLFRTEQPGRYAISEGPDGRVDTVFRSLEMARHAIRLRWPDTPEEVLPQTEPDRMEPIIHAVYPVIGPAPPPTASGAKTRNWRSAYILERSRFVLSRGRYNEFPFMVPRWTKASGEIYGRGPSHTALPDVRSLNKIEELELRAAAKTIDPPLAAVSGDVVGPIRLVPGGVTTVRGGRDSVFPLLSGAIDLRVSNLKAEELRASIRAIYKADQIVLREGPQMTATEVNARMELMQRLLGPTLGRLEAELLDPLIRRAYGVMMRNQLIPPFPQLPEPLATRYRDLHLPLRVRYEGPLARAQKTADVNAVQLLQTAIAGLLRLKPDALDVIDADEAVRHTAQVLGVPARLIRDQQAVAEIRSVRGQQIAASSAAEELERAASAAGKLAPLVKAGGLRPQHGSLLHALVDPHGAAAAIGETGSPAAESPAAPESDAAATSDAAQAE